MLSLLLSKARKANTLIQTPSTLTRVNLTSVLKVHADAGSNCTVQGGRQYMALRSSAETLRLNIEQSSEHECRPHPFLPPRAQPSPSATLGHPLSVYHIKMKLRLVHI